MIGALSIAELGHYALVLSLTLMLVQSVVPLIGIRWGDERLVAVSGSTPIVGFAFMAIAFAALTAAYVTSDFSVKNVWENSHSAKPMIFKISGVWGNHEGSMLLWVLILGLFGALVALFGGNLPHTLRARVIAVQGWIASAFLVFILFTSNPFTRLHPAPLEGRDLNPILQDIGLAIHPPLLYLGYVGFSIAFAFAVAALLEGRTDSAWARWVRPWTLAAWVFLTAGIAMGSYWAYYELGWGGWWFWDPVENASFLPWLSGTALLHSAVVMEKRGALKVWTVLLAILTFSLSLLGTFLVRSGVLTSVHTFAVDPQRGTFILALLTLYTGAALLIYALKAPKLESKASFAPDSRESALVLNNLFMVTACATVLIGTLYPLILDALDAGQIAVGPPYYNATFVPLMIPAVVLMGLAPAIAWKKSELKTVWNAIGSVLIVTVIATVAVGILSADGPVMAVAGLALALWLGLATLSEWVDRTGMKWSRIKTLPLSSYAMSTAHLGLAVAIFGMVGSTLWMEEKVAFMKEGDRLGIGRYELILEEIGGRVGTNYAADAAVFEIRTGGKPAGTLTPERRYYPVAQQTTTEAAIRTSWRDDIYVALGEQNENKPDYYVVRAYVHPLIPFLWGGFALIALGGLLALTGRRNRTGAKNA